MIGFVFGVICLICALFCIGMFIGWIQSCNDEARKHKDKLNKAI